VAGILKKPKKLLTKFSLGIDDQNVCHIGSTIRSGGPFRGAGR